jgi:hypothetical protein
MLLSLTIHIGWLVNEELVTCKKKATLLCSVWKHSAEDVNWNHRYLNTGDCIPLTTLATKSRSYNKRYKHSTNHHI